MHLKSTILADLVKRVPFFATIILVAPQASNQERSAKALAERATNSFDALGTWDDENSVFEATMMAIEDVQGVVRNSGESANNWDRNEDLKDDVLAFLRAAREDIEDLRTEKRPVFHRFSLRPGQHFGSETYSTGGSTIKKITRDTPLSLLLQSALIAHMVIFARANGSIKGTIFQNPAKGELSEKQKLSRHRYIEGMLLGIVDNLNILGWNTGADRKAAVNTIVRHLPEVTNAMMSGEMIRNALKNAGGEYAKQSDELVKKTFNYAAKVDILVGNPASLEAAILARATSALFLKDRAWLQEQLKELAPPAKELAFASIQSGSTVLEHYRTEKSLQERLKALKENAAIFADETRLKKTLEIEHHITFSAPISEIPPSFIRFLLINNMDTLVWFSQFLRGEKEVKFGTLNSAAIRARLRPRALKDGEPSSQIEVIKP